MSVHDDPCYWGHEAGCEHMVDPGVAFTDVVEVATDEEMDGPDPDEPKSSRDTQVGGNHYRKFKIQPWDVIDEYGLTFYAGNALKYLLRAGHKGVALEDLRKARHYLDRMIEIEEERKEG